MPVENLSVATEGPVRVLRLDRANKKNALTRAMYSGLTESLQAAAQEPCAQAEDARAGNARRKAERTVENRGEQQHNSGQKHQICACADGIR